LQPEVQVFTRDEVSDFTQSCEGTAQSRSFGNAIKTTAGIQKIQAIAQGEQSFLEFLNAST
jgi:hypothetical protein